MLYAPRLSGITRLGFFRPTGSVDVFLYERMKRFEKRARNLANMSIPNKKLRETYGLDIRWKKKYTLGEAARFATRCSWEFHATCQL